MANESKTFGRTELAQLYFPYILPHSAWKKFKSLLEDIPALQHLTTLRRRSFLPAEVNIIYQQLGHLRRGSLNRNASDRPFTRNAPSPYE